MTPAAVKAAAKVVSQTILAEFNSYLLIGSLCRRDHSIEEVCDTGGRITVSVPQPIPAPQYWTDGTPPKDTKDVDFRLQDISYSFDINDVSELLIGNSSVTEHIRLAAEHLSDHVEMALFRELGTLPYYNFGETSRVVSEQLLNKLDDLLFDGTSMEQIYLLTPDTSMELEMALRNKPTFELCVPPDEHKHALSNIVAFRRDALVFATRRMHIVEKQAESQLLFVESEDFGLTLLATPNHQQRSVRIDIHALFAAGILREEMGIRMLGTVPAAPVVRSSSGVPEPEIISQPSMQDVALSLADALSDPLIDRLRTTIDSLTDSIPDAESRLKVALRLLSRTDGIQIDQLVECCRQQHKSIQITRLDFDAAVEFHVKSEINLREDAAEKLIDEICDLQNKMDQLRSKHELLLAEISHHNDLVHDSSDKFNSDVDVIEHSIRELERDLNAHMDTNTITAIRTVHTQ